MKAQSVSPYQPPDKRGHPHSQGPSLTRPPPDVKLGDVLRLLLRGGHGHPLLPPHLGVWDHGPGVQISEGTNLHLQTMRIF